jgi:hypothetical protein
MDPMTKRARLLARTAALTGLAALTIAGPARVEAADRPMAVDLGGRLRIQQSLPSACGDVDLATAVAQGVLELTPSGGRRVPGGLQFTLTRSSVSFAPFTVRRACFGQSETREYTEIGVGLARAVTFVASPVDPKSSAYRVTIPREAITFVEAAIVNGRLETGSRHPDEDVTGLIDLAAGRVSLTVRLVHRVHLELGCFPGRRCAVNDDYPGLLEATLNGTIAFAPEPDADGKSARDAAGKLGSR